MSHTTLIISTDELCLSENVHPDYILEIVEYGIAQPISGDSPEDWIFNTASVPWLKKAIEYHIELEIDWFSVAMIIKLLKQKQDLIEENHHLKRRIKR